MGCFDFAAAVDTHEPARLRLGETELATLILRQRGVTDAERFARIYATWPR